MAKRTLRELKTAEEMKIRKNLAGHFSIHACQTFMQIVYAHGSWFRLCPHFFTEGLDTAFVGLLGMLATLNNEQRVCQSYLQGDVEKLF